MSWALIDYLRCPSSLLSSYLQATCPNEKGFLRSAARRAFGRVSGVSPSDEVSKGA